MSPDARSSITPLTRPSSMKPMCEMVEYASMRFTLVCAMATTLPSAIDRMASSMSIFCHSTASVGRPLTSRRIAMAKPASLGAEPMSSVMAVGAP